MTWELQIALGASLLAWFFFFHSMTKETTEFHEDPGRVRIGAAIYAAANVAAFAIPFITAFSLIEEMSALTATVMGLFATLALFFIHSDYLFRTPFVGVYLFAYSFAAARLAAKNSVERIEKIEKLGDELGL